MNCPESQPPHKTRPEKEEGRKRKTGEKKRINPTSRLIKLLPVDNSFPSCLHSTSRFFPIPRFWKSQIRCLSSSSLFFSSSVNILQWAERTAHALCIPPICDPRRVLSLVAAAASLSLSDGNICSTGPLLAGNALLQPAVERITAGFSADNRLQLHCQPKQQRS